MIFNPEDFKTKNELFSYLRSNKNKIVDQKKSMPITSDNNSYGCKSISYYKTDSVKKGKELNNDLSPDEIKVSVIANLSGWCDSHMDVLIPNCWDRTISEVGASNKQLIYHLKNHNYSTDSIIGRSVQMTSEEVDLSQFNISSDLKTAQALIGTSIVSKRYDRKAYELYFDDEVKQHSIGLRYVDLALCVNSDDDDDKKEKENWDKYYKYVINKDKVDRYGFFWAVTEINLLEYSAVLFGSNELTTVQETEKQKSTVDADNKKSSKLFYKNLN